MGKDPWSCITTLTRLGDGIGWSRGRTSLNAIHHHSTSEPETDLNPAGLESGPAFLYQPQSTTL